jgi:threonine synthase
MLMNMAVRYTSTRNALVNVSIAEAIVQGMPKDGGLFVPREIPRLPPEALSEPGLPYAELAWMVLSPWFDWPEHELRPLIEEAYSSTGDSPMFDVQEIVPLAAAGSLGCDVRLPGTSGAPSLFLLELFHGRTCAFKDLALSLLGGLLGKSREECGIDEPMLILTATSGDTGSAALAGLGGQPGIRIAVIYPAEGTSEIQRLQMTSVPADGRFVVGLRGNFDDAQRTVKAIFQTANDPDSPFYGLRLSSANSINIGRLLPQIVYYVKAWRDLIFSGALERDRPFDVVVPSGNFGDILAARYAKAMGIPIRKLVCASNSNRILHDFFSTGLYDRRREFSKTLSPSMDILVSSNLERLLYLALDDNPELVAAMMSKFEHEGFFQLPEHSRTKIADFSAGWADDSQTLVSIRHMWEAHGRLVDPHTAVACAVAHESIKKRGTEIETPAPVVIAATASPFKFPAACLAALQGPLFSSHENTGDLQLAFELSHITGIPVPTPIAALADAKIRHRTTSGESDLASLLADFAHQPPQATLEKQLDSARSL